MKNTYPAILGSIILSTLMSNLCFGTYPVPSWSYIQIDDSRQKWGDWNEPEWLRYFGLDAGDLNGDKQPDIVSGRYVYFNPGGNMENPWPRIDVGMNTDGALIMDVDGDAFADVISTSLPDVYWLEAKNKEATEWTSRKIAQIKETGHVNGQGFAIADIFAGGKKEILLAGGNGIYAITIPDDPEAGIWPTVNLIPDASDEGFAAGDIDGDGDLDIAASKMVQDGEWEAPKILFWWENSGFTGKAPMIHEIHHSEHDIDRICVADFNGDGRMDVAYSEERYPGPDPDAKLVWLEAPQNPCKSDSTVFHEQSGYRRYRRGRGHRHRNQRTQGRTSSDSMV